MRRPKQEDDLGMLPSFREMGFTENRRVGNQVYGDCPFCGGENKLYVNWETGQWDCKRGTCLKAGNLFTFMKYYYDQARAWSMHGSQRALWVALAEDRSIHARGLKAVGTAFDGEKWVFPVRNQAGAIITFLTWRTGQKVHLFTGVDSGIFGLEQLTQKPNAKVWLVEGPWDRAALEYAFKLEGRADTDIVLAVPGCGTFKEEWANHFMGRKVAVMYDYDIAGQRGVWKVRNRLTGIASTIQQLAWNETFPNHYDLRDFFRQGGTLEVLEEMTGDILPEPEGTTMGQGQTAPAPDERPLLREAMRPTFDEILTAYGEWLYMTPDLIEALKITYATIFTNQIQGCPLWLHIVGPGGSGKTEILMSASGCQTVHWESSITPASLVSGWNSGGDPSLIPQLHGKTFVLKDFTEVLKMNKTQKDEVYSTLRGAFDGEVHRPFGNGVTRDYRVHFNMLSGVTQAILAEQGQSLVGERFLMFHLRKLTDYAVQDSLIEMALTNGGSENTMKEALSNAAVAFLEYRIEEADIPEPPRPILRKVVALAQLVAALRACVEKSQYGDKILYRPSTELGTRIGKQLKKLLQGLAFLKTEFIIDEADYKIVARVGIDSCIGFNLDIIRQLIKQPAMSAGEIGVACDIPYMTLNDQLEDLCALQLLTRKQGEADGTTGRPSLTYTVNARLKQLWGQAGISDLFPEEELAEVLRDNFSARVKARKKRAGDKKHEEELIPARIMPHMAPIKRTGVKAKIVRRHAE